MSHFLSYKGFHWEYEVFGSGKETMFAFHGFGNNSSDFRILESSIGKKYNVISFSLPFHGNSRVDESAPMKTISKDTLKAMFRLFLDQHPTENFSLMGYSLGGKIALQLIELFPEKIKTVILFAPDGIRNNWSNGFVTKYGTGKKIFQGIIQDPSRFFRLVRMLQRINLVHDKLSDFLQNSLDTRKKRQLVWDVWMCFREIKPNISKIQNLINKNKIHVHLFFGKYDKVIPPSIGEQFVKKLSDKNCLHIVDMGHNLVKEKMNNYLLLVKEIVD